MKFAQPAWFWLLLPLAAWVAAHWARHSAAALPYSSLRLLSRWASDDRNERRILASIRALAFAFMIAALARPQKISTLTEPPKPVVDILLALDTSTSMSALDFDPKNRLEAAKQAAENFIRKRPLDRLGLVVFGGKAILQCPLTLDHESLIELLRSVPVNATGAEGTAVGSGIALAADALAKSEAKTKIIVLLTDGRSNTGALDPITAATAAADLGIKVYTIGCAVPGGGVIPIEDPVFGKRMVQMAEDLDENSLLEIARITGAKYFRVTSEKRLKEIYDQIDQMEKTQVETATLSQAHDRYAPFLALGLLLLLAAWALELTVWRTVP